MQTEVELIDQGIVVVPGWVKEDGTTIFVRPLDKLDAYDERGLPNPHVMWWEKGEYGEIINVHIPVEQHQAV